MILSFFLRSLPLFFLAQLHCIESGLIELKVPYFDLIEQDISSIADNQIELPDGNFLTLNINGATLSYSQSNGALDEKQVSQTFNFEDEAQFLHKDFKSHYRNGWGRVGNGSARIGLYYGKGILLMCPTLFPFDNNGDFIPVIGLSSKFGTLYFSIKSQEFGIDALNFVRCDVMANVIDGEKEGSKAVLIFLKLYVKEFKGLSARTIVALSNDINGNGDAKSVASRATIGMRKSKIANAKVIDYESGNEIKDSFNFKNFTFVPQAYSESDDTVSLSGGNLLRRGVMDVNNGNISECSSYVNSFWKCSADGSNLYPTTLSRGTSLNGASDDTYIPKYNYNAMIYLYNERWAVRRQISDAPFPDLGIKDVDGKIVGMVNKSMQMQLKFSKPAHTGWFKSGPPDLPFDDSKTILVSAPLTFGRCSTFFSTPIAGLLEDKPVIFSCAVDPGTPGAPFTKRIVFALIRQPNGGPVKCFPLYLCGDSEILNSRMLCDWQQSKNEMGFNVVNLGNAFSKLRKSIYVKYDNIVGISIKGKGNVLYNMSPIGPAETK